MKRVLSFFAMLVLLLVTIIPISPSAASPYEMSEAYQGSPYYRALLSCSLTGDMRRDVLTVAFTQIGYHEGNSDSDMDGLNIFGGRNFVEYNRVFGKLDNGEGNGVSYGYAWCASFVSWCLRQAGVSESVAPTEVSCSRMTNWFEENKAYHPRSDEYTPLPGDIVMFHYGNNIANHVGFVIGVENETVYTIEGNSGDAVGVHRYPLYDGSILGYCVPAYTLLDGTSYEFPTREAWGVPGEYTVIADGLNVRAIPDGNGSVLGVLPMGQKIYITPEEDGQWGYLQYEGKSAWVSLAHVFAPMHPISILRYSTEGGEDGPAAQIKRPGELLHISESVPKRQGYTFEGWSTDPQGKGTIYKAGDVYNADEDMTLYALWQPKIYTLTLMLDDGTLWQKIDLPYGTKISASDLIPTKESDGQYSYTFAEWDRDLPQYLYSNAKRTARFVATPLPSDNGSEAPPAEPQKQSTTVIILAIAAGGTALTVLILIVVLKLKKRRFVPKK